VARSRSQSGSSASPSRTSCKAGRQPPGTTSFPPLCDRGREAAFNARADQADRLSPRPEEVVAIADTGIVLRPLDELSTELAAEHDRCEDAYRQALEHALRCGDLLIEAKAQLSRGEWQTWLGENFPGSDRTARGYMQLARNRHQLERRPVAVLGIRATLKQIAAPRPTVEETLAGLGSSEGAMDELGGSAPEREPPPWASFRRSGIWRTTMANIERMVRKGEVTVQSARETHGLFPEAAADMLREAAGSLEEAARDLRALADYILEGRR
jgi:hypothetical protein